jgi:hypothetical protein
MPYLKHFDILVLKITIKKFRFINMSNNKNLQKTTQKTTNLNATANKFLS